MTNLAAPYRLPLWRALSRGWDLQVQLTEGRLGAVGAENRGSDWAADAGHGIDVVTLRTVRLVLRGVPMQVLTGRRGARRVRSTDVVLLGGWEAPVFWQIFVLARFHRRAVVGFYESTLRTNRYRRGPVAAFRAWMFRRMDGVVVPGAAAREAVEAMGVRPERIVEGFNAVDVEGIASAVRASRERSTPSGPGVRFLYIGQLISRKRVLETAEAFLAGAGAHDVLAVVGTGELEGSLQGLVRARHAEDRVELRGHVPNADLPELLAASDVLLLVSDEEVWGLVVNEALAAGMHVIVAAGLGVTPSVSSMPGVHVVQDDLSDLTAMISRLALDPPTRIAEPPILELGPESFSRAFDRAFQAAIDQRSGRR